MKLSRLLRYYALRIGRLPGTPRSIAAGFAVGIAVSFTPFIGFHLATGALVAWILRGSLVSMALGTLLAGNPWTFPFIWLCTYELGRWMMGAHQQAAAMRTFGTQFTFSDLLQKPLDLLLPMTLGSIPLGLACGVAGFYAVRAMVHKRRSGLK